MSKRGNLQDSLMNYLQSIAIQAVQAQSANPFVGDDTEQIDDLLDDIEGDLDKARAVLMRIRTEGEE
jgi:hypothetical protein